MDHLSADSRTTRLSSAFVTSLILAMAPLTAGCESTESKKCDRLVKISLANLSAMNPSDQTSVEETMSGLKEALTFCKKAKRSEEVADISDAMSNVGTHLEKLAKVKEEAKKRPKLQKRTPEDWAKIEKEGDPVCPIGQGYKHPQKKEVVIKCKGPALVQRNWQKTAEHFASHGFQLMSNENEMRATKGDANYTYQFEKSQSDKPPLCIKITPPKGQKWQEAVSLATNVPVNDLEKNKPVRTGSGDFALKVIEEDELVIVELGLCKESKPSGSAPAEKQPMTEKGAEGEGAKPAQ